MTSANSSAIPTLSVTATRRIDAMCDTVEDALKTGREYRLEDCLATVQDSLHSALLRQLLLMEWEYRHQRDERIDMADYFVRFPEHDSVIREASKEHTLEMESRRGEAVDSQSSTSELSAQAKQDWEAQGYVIQGRLGRGGMGAV